MNVLKKLMAVCLIVTLAISMVACTKEANNEKQEISSNKKQENSKVDNEKDKAPEGKEETVVVWSANRHDADYCNEKVAEFNEANKGRIQIEYVVHTDNYVNMMMMASSSKQLPDVMNIASITKGFNVQNFADANIIQPLNKYITDDFAKQVDLANVTYQGMNAVGDDVYYIPTGLRSGSRLIYNKELFERAGIISMPKNAQEIIDAAKKITEVGKGKEYGYVVPGLSAPWARMFDPMAKVSGITEYDYKNGRFDFTGFKPIIEMARQLFENDSVLPGAAGMKMDPSRVQFSEGNVGFYGSMSQEVGVLTNQFPAKIPWGAAEIPSLDGEVKGVLAAAPNMGWMMSSQTDKAEAAWEVIEFFTSDEFIVGYIEAGLNLPITKRIEGLVDKSKIGMLAEFSLLDYESVYPIPPQVSPKGLEYKQALWEACLPDGPDIDKALADLTKDYNEALDNEVKMGKVKRLVIKDYDPLNPTGGTFEYLDK